MQVLWSRAQARAACRCGSCLHAAIARRTTTAAGRRRLKLSDLFTACYSTLLGTAVFADAKVKEDRRKEWDRVIAEAKAGISINGPEGVEGTQLQPLSDPLGLVLSSEGNIPAQNSLSKTTWGGNGWTVPPRTQQASLESRLKILDTQLKEVSLPSTSLAQQEAELPDHLGKEWIEETPNAALSPREPKQELHLRKMEEMVWKLVEQLLLQTSMFSEENSPVLGPSEIREQMNDIAHRIETLRTGFTRVPAYCWDSNESVEEQRSALHRSLTTLCHRTTASKPSLDLMLVKICYNLLISTAPPSITTYNTLLREFNRLQQSHLSQIVVDSYFYESRLKLNMATCRLILDHYRIKQDPEGFSAILKKMGGHAKGVRIRRRHATQLLDPYNKGWALSNKVILREAHLYQKMPREAAIFDSMICGSLEMKGIRCAIRYVRAAFREGFEVSSETLCNVIRRCVKEIDHAAGLSLLRAILWWTAWDFSLAFSSNSVRSHVYKLLDFCGIDSSLGSQQRLPPNFYGETRELLDEMLRHMRIESIASSVARFAERISSLENILHYSDNQLSLGCQWKDSSMLEHDRVRQALKLLRIAKTWDVKREKTKRHTIAEGRSMRLRYIEAMLGASANWINRRECELLPFAVARLSTEQKNQYLESIRLRESRGTAVEIPERLEFICRHLGQTQSQEQQKRDESPPNPSLKRIIQRNLPAEAAVDAQPPALLLPLFPVHKPQHQAAAL